MIDTKLVTFLTLLEEKSYTKTASRLYITQPAVTHHIKTLEKEYDITLFTNSKTFDLTKAGSMLLEYAKNQKMQEELLMSNLQKQDVTVYNIGFTSMVRDIFPQFVDSIKKYDSVPLFNAYCHSYKEISELLLRGKIDFAFVDNSFDSSNFESVLVTSEKIILVGRPDGQYKSKDKVTRDQLATATLVNGSVESGLYKCVEATLKGKNIQLKNNSIVNTNDPGLMKAMLRMNDGLAFMYYDSVKDDIESGKLKKFELLNLQITQNIYLLYNKSFPVDESFSKILESFSKIGK